MFDKNELDILKYDSSKVKRKLIEQIESGTDYTLSLVDPTNPFIMLLEATTVLTTNALEEMVNNTSRIYPSMSRSVDDLYHHMTDEQEKNLFATPSEAYVRIMLNKNDIINNGVYNDVDGRHKVIIPKNTAIKVSDVIFTTLNDIDIYVLDTDGTKDKSFVEQKVSEDDFNSINSLGNLNSVIVKDVEKIDWVVFDTKIKQINRLTLEDTIVMGVGYKKKIPITDQYYYSDVYIKKNNKWQKINKVFSDTVLDANVPSVRVKVLENSILYEIPSIYILNGSISGLIRIDVFETKGKILMPLDKYNTKDFKIYYGRKTETTSTTLEDNQAAAAIRNITSLALSKDILDGGINTRLHKDVRTKIIHNTTGNIDLPITELQLNEKARLFGFTLYKALDTVTERIYIAGKNINTNNGNLLPSNIDVFNNQTSIIISEVDDLYKSVIKYNDSILIKSNTIFETINGITKIVTNAVAHRLENTPLVDIRESLQNNNYLYTPFYYVLDKTLDVLNSRIYDLDNPIIDNISIVNKNINIPTININVSSYVIEKISSGYRIAMKMIKSEPYGGVGELRAQLSLPITGTTKKIYFDSVIDSVSDIVEFYIDTDFYVNDKDDISITNGYSDIDDVFSLLNIKATLIAYIIDDITIVTNDNYGPNEELHFRTMPNNPIGLCKEIISLKFGDRLRYLWSNMSGAYTLRKYRKHLTNELAVYEENYYDVDNETGCVVDVLDSNNDGSCDCIDYTYLKNKGDPILDGNGDQIYKHRAGDNILDENNNPIINLDGGVVRYVDILMLQYEYKTIKNVKYIDYVTSMIKLIKSWLIVEMVDLNKVVLEHTNILFQPKKSFKNVELIDKTLLDPVVKPSVILYVDKDRYDEVYSENELIVIIGKIIHKYLDKKVIEMKKLKDEIMNTLGNTVIGVKIYDISPYEKDVYKLTDNSNRFSMKKIINTYSDVVYDLKLSIEKL